MAKTKQAAKTTEPTEGLLEGVLEATVGEGEALPAACGEPGQAPGIAPERIPNINDQDWTGFVLSKLYPDELFDHYPTVDGLVRVCNEYLGTILSSTSTVNQAPSLANGNHACVTHDLVIAHPQFAPHLGELAGKVSKYSGVADVFAGNGSKESFSWRFSSATCETRAKGRALRFALRLRGVVAQEERSGLTDDESGVDGYINANQFNSFNVLCRRMDVDAEKFLRGLWKKHHPDEKEYGDLRLMPFSAAQKAFQTLLKWQQDASQISPLVVGYNDAWQRGPR